MIFSKLFWQKFIGLLVGNIEISPQVRNIYAIDSAIKRIKAVDYEIMDDEYDTITLQKMQEILKNFPTLFPDYDLKRFDCDNFAIAFWGLVKVMYPRLSVGMITLTRASDRHALNIFISNSNVVYIIEPQNLTIQEFFNYKAVYGVKSVERVMI